MHYAFINKETGEPISYASTLPKELPEEFEAVEVDGPPNGRVWDKEKRTFGETITSRPSRIARAKALWPDDDSNVPDFAKALAVALGIKD